MDKVERALSGIRRRFIGGYQTRVRGESSKHMPHQGQQEMARRLRQAAKIAAKRGS